MRLNNRPPCPIKSGAAAQKLEASIAPPVPQAGKKMSHSVCRFSPAGACTAAYQRRVGPQALARKRWPQRRGGLGFRAETAATGGHAIAPLRCCASWSRARCAACCEPTPPPFKRQHPRRRASTLAHVARGAWRASRAASPGCRCRCGSRRSPSWAQPMSWQYHNPPPSFRWQAEHTQPGSTFSASHLPRWRAGPRWQTGKPAPPLCP